MKKIILTAAALALSTSAMAGPSWTYAELNYVIGDTSEGGSSSADSRLTGYNLQGSLGLGMFHVAAEWATWDTKKNFGTDIDSYSLRAGIHPSVTDNIDLFAELGYTGYDLKDLTAGDAPTEIDVAVGVRAMIGDNLELRTSLAIASGDTDTANSDFTDTRFGVGGAWYFTDAISLDIDYETIGAGNGGSGGQDIIEIGARWSFGNIM
jgi:hypothetical protein